MFAKNRGYEICLFFLRFFGSLIAPRDGLICNPYTLVQSKHRFATLHSSESFQTDGPILGASLINNVILNEKKGLRDMVHKKGTAKTQTATYVQAKRLPDSPLACAAF